MKKLNLAPARILVPLLSGTLLLAGFIFACFDHWSPSICYDLGAACLWTQDLGGSLDNEPDMSSQLNTCSKYGGDVAARTWIASFGGSTWLFTCCYRDNLIMEPEGPPVA